MSTTSNETTSENREPGKVRLVGKGRRRVLTSALGAAVAVAGAGTLIHASADTAHADSTGVFSSSVAGTPAVSATGTNGADGIDASSDTGTGISATSKATAISAYSHDGTGVSANSVTGTAISGSSIVGDGVYGSSAYGGAGVYGTSTRGIGVVAVGGESAALQVQGTIQVQGNAVGHASIPAGSVSVTVTTPAATTNSIVILTPMSNPDDFLWVTPKAGSFTIHISKAPTSALKIAYLVIN